MAKKKKVPVSASKCSVCTRGSYETFRYMNSKYIFNINKAREIVQDGREPVEMDPEDVKFSLKRVHITKEHLPHVDLKYPGIIALVQYTNPDGEMVQGHRLIDGHHRAARSQQLGVPYYAYLLSEEESREILQRSPEMAHSSQ